MGKKTDSTGIGLSLIIPCECGDFACVARVANTQFYGEEVLANDYCRGCGRAYHVKAEIKIRCDGQMVGPVKQGYDPELDHPNGPHTWWKREED